MIKNALLLFFICAAVFLFFLPSYVKMQDLNEKNRTYEKRIADLESENVRIADERRNLAEDPAYFEKVAREKMGIIKDGEVIYKVVGPGQKRALVTEETAGLLKDGSQGLAEDLDPFSDDPLILDDKSPGAKKKTVYAGTKAVNKAKKVPVVKAVE